MCLNSSLFWEIFIFNITILLGRLEADMKSLEEAKYTYFKSISEAAHVSEAIRLLETFIEEANRRYKNKATHWQQSKYGHAS